MQLFVCLWIEVMDFVHYMYVYPINSCHYYLIN